MKNSLNDFAEIIRSKHGSKVAYKFLENNVIVERTYNDLADNIESVKTFLLKNYKERNKIVIISESSYQWITLSLGIYQSNNILVSVDYNLSTKEIIDIIQFLEAEIVFISSKQYEKVKEKLNETNTKIYIIEDSINNIYKEKDIINCKTDSAELGHILFTSGTTSSKKGVMLSYSNIESAIFNDEFEFDDKMMISLLPMYHCLELFCGNIFRLYRGSTICINDDMNKLMENMQKFKPTLITVVPELAIKFNNIINKLGIDTFNKMTGGNLRTISLGGASISKEVLQNLQKYGINTYQGYGLTETTSCCLSTGPNNMALGTVGNVINKCLEAKINEHGELLIKGASVMMGYYKNKEATNAAIKDGWLYTGDLAKYDDNKNIIILGRKVNKIVLSNGKNIFPEELEERINNIGGVLNSLIYEKSDKLNVLIRIEDNLTEEIESSIKEQIENSIAELNKEFPLYKQIHTIDFTHKQFPVTTTKKIKRQILLSKLDEYISKNEITKEYIYQKINEILDKDTFNYDDNIFDLGLNSLSTIELSCILKISAEDIYKNPTVNKLYILINNKTISNKEDLKINDLIKINKNIEKPFKEKIILMTGATGYLGAHILHLIWKKYEKIYCLVRSKQKLYDIYNYYFSEEFPENIKVIVGNIEEPLLGLEEEKYYKYIKKVNGVIHCAANVNHVGDFDKIYKTNVVGTKNIIKFCRQSNSVLHYMSTYSTSGLGLCEQTKDVEFNENILDIGQKYTDNVYVNTKYEAEKEVLEARLDGLLVNIYRIGSLTWRSTDGVFQINSQSNGITKRINGMLKSKNITKDLENAQIDFTPVNECAQAFLKLMSDKKINNIYHLFNPKLFHINSITNTIQNRKYITVEDMREKIKTEVDEDIKVYYYYNTLKNTNVKITAESTTKKLGKLGFDWSTPDLRYLSLYKDKGVKVKL